MFLDVYKRQALFFFFKQKTAYEIMPSLVGSEMCIRDRWKDEENADVITNKAIEYIQKSAKAKEPFFLMFATHDIHVPRCPEKRFVGKSQHGVRGDVTVELDDCVRRITEALQKAGPVSYTHLTLPTIYSV